MISDSTFIGFDYKFEGGNNKYHAEDPNSDHNTHDTHDDDAAVRDRAHGWVYDDLLERGEVDEEVRRLRDQVAAAPYDVEASEALIDLLERVLELLGDRLAFDPTSVRLLRRRAGLYEEMGRFEEALADHEALARLPGVDAEAVRLRQARCALLLGDPARAERALMSLVYISQVPIAS